MATMVTWQLTTSKVRASETGAETGTEGTKTQVLRDVYTVTLKSAAQTGDEPQVPTADPNYQQVRDDLELEWGGHNADPDGKPEAEIVDTDYHQVPKCSPDAAVKSITWGSPSIDDAEAVSTEALQDDGDGAWRFVFTFQVVVTYSPGGE